MFDISVRIMVSMCRVDAVPMVVLYGRKRKFDRGMEEEGCGMRWESSIVGYLQWMSPPCSTHQYMQTYKNRNPHSQHIVGLRVGPLCTVSA